MPITIIDRRGTRQRVRCRGARYAAMLASLSVSFPVVAAQWTVQPVFDVGAIRDSNVPLTTGPHESTSGYVGAARMQAERKTETSEADFEAFLARTFYDTATLDDRSEYGLRFDARQRTSERGTLSLDGQYRRDTLFQNIIVQSGVGDVRDVDEGLSPDTEVRRTYRVARPSFNWLLTERSSVLVSLRLTDVNFRNTPGTNFIDYREDLLSSSYTRQLTERDQLILTGNFVRYRPDVATTRSDSLQALVGFRRVFSETLSGSLSVGASRTDEETSTRDDTSTGVVTSATVQQRSELSTLTGIVSRDVTPSGVGRALRTDQVRVSWNRKLAPMVEFVLDARLLRSRLVEGSDPTVDRRYYDVTPQLRWQWLEDVAIVGSYRYRRQKFDAEDDAAVSRAVFLGLSYRL